MRRVNAGAAGQRGEETMHENARGAQQGTIPLKRHGLDRWEEIVHRLPELLDALLSAPPIQRSHAAKIPLAPGLYLLSEGLRPVYVGQTRNLRRRLAQHGGSWARQNQATFAFALARTAGLAANPTLARHRTRNALAEDPAFAALFRDQRERVAAMSVQVVEVDDPELRTVFEVYAAVVLGTENKFETH